MRQKAHRMKQLYFAGLPPLPRRRKFTFNPKEYRISTLRECPVPNELHLCDTPDGVSSYWHEHVLRHPYFNPEVECFVVLLLNTRRRVRGHHFVSTGTLDTILVHPREIFRAAVIGAAAALVCARNHPSGDASPSEADIKITRDLIRAGQLLKIELLDHVIIGQPTSDNPRGFASLRELGYFYH
jgi:DNA repair protein RadC